MARIFVLKIGVLPERVLLPLLNDRMVAKGTILAFVTDFFVDFLATESVDDLVALLKKAKMDDRLSEFFPPSQRTPELLNAHFKVCCLPRLPYHDLQVLTGHHIPFHFLHPSCCSDLQYAIQLYRG